KKSILFIWCTIIIIHIFCRLSYTVYKKCKNDNICLIQSLQKYNELHTSYTVQKRRKTVEERKFNRIIEYSPKAKTPIVDVWRNITIAEIGEVLKQDVEYVYDLFLNQFTNPNMPITDIKVLQQAIRRSGCRMRLIGNPKDNRIEEDVKKDVFPRAPPKREDLKPRPPVVTVMGHVDHGKTTLLDALRHSNVVDQEFGGITQHIGAFSVVLDSGARITFLDTPGHAAFSSMRARGANLTDIVILVVAADDGVMEQTVESIKMARHAKVPILVAINKIDAPKADIERTEKMLVEVGIQVEKLGGDVQAIPISALKKKNLDQLTEALILQAELLEIGADPTGPVEATVVESRVDPHRGKLCTVVVQRGTLKKGDILVAGTAMAKVRGLRDAEGKLLQKVSPGYPTEIEGWKDVPPAGEQVLQVESERKAREVLKIREGKKEKEKLEEDSKVIAQKIEQHEREYKEKLELKRKLGRYKVRREGPRLPEISRDDGEISLNLIIKADVDGTLEAILDTLDTYESTECKMDLVHYGLIDDVIEEINARLPTKEVEEILGEATVLQQFEITQGRKKIPVAGCRCVKGNLRRTAMYKVIRNGEVIYAGPVLSMRHLKNEVDVVKTDTECSLQLSDKSINFEQGDTIICFENKTVPQKTDWNPGF
ncbi:hypothetical protein NQ314_009286, partial [Rhamnusium bicolor]